MAKEKTKYIRIRETAHEKLVKAAYKSNDSIVDFASDAIVEKILSRKKKEARMKK